MCRPNTVPVLQFWISKLEFFWGILAHDLQPSPPLYRQSHVFVGYREEEATICRQRRRQGPPPPCAISTERHATRLHAAPLSTPRSSRQMVYFLLSRLWDRADATSATRTLTRPRQHQIVYRYEAATTVWKSKERFFVCACHIQETALAFTGQSGLTVALPNASRPDP